MVPTLLHHTEYRHKLDGLLETIRSQFKHNALVHRDLITIWRNCNTQYMLLDSELVNCRRKNKPTVLYQTLANKLDAMLATLEKRITWAALL